MSNNKNREFVRTLHGMIADFLRDNPDIDRSYYQEIWDWLEKKEDEDEIHRKWILDYLHVGLEETSEDFKEQFRAAIAWLEKLKEQPMELLEPDKNVEKIIEDVIRIYGKTQGGWIGGYDIDMLIVNLRRAFKQKEQRPIINFPVFIEEKNIEQVIKKFLGESAKFQKEQTFTHHEINESLQDAVTHQMEDDGDVDDFVRRGIDDIVLKYAEIGAKWQKEQKPAEWSEEDSERYISIGTVLEVSTLLSKEEYDADMTWLRELVNAKKFSGQRAKQEWSEEDENIRHDIIARLESLLKYETQYIAKACLQKEISWFKSLSRPKPSDDWKPSKYMLSLVKKVADGEMLTGVEQMAMGTLHEQLKKL